MKQCIWNGKEMVHIWVYAGDPNYFPYEGMPCDCGEVKYHKEEIKNEKERQIDS